MGSAFDPFLQRLRKLVWFGNRDTLVCRRPSKGQTRTPKRTRLRVECLEDRTVPATFFVSTAGSDAADGLTAATAFRTIQRAIDEAAAASDGNDEIRVRTGTYNTAAVDLAFTIPSDADITNLKILGGWSSDFSSRDPNANPTVYIPQNAGSVVAADVDVFDDDVIIDGMVFVFDGVQGAGGTRESAGIISRGQNLTISNNTIEVGAGDANFDAYGLQTFFNSNQGTLTITDNQFISNNTAAFRSGGIYLNPGTATAILVDGNTVSGSNLWQGIVADSISNVTISNNTLFRTGPADVDFQQFIYAGPFNGSADQTNVTISGNFINLTSDGGTLVSDSVGIEIGNTSGNGFKIENVTLSNNTVQNNLLNLFISEGADDLTVDGGSYTEGVIGIFARNVDNLTIQNATVDDNSNDGFRGSNLTGTLTVTNSSFSGNGADGIDLTNIGDIEFEGVTANGNDPGLVVNGAASFSDTDGTYSNNNNGGIVLIDIVGDVTLVRTTADNNDADNDGDGNGVTLLDGTDLNNFAVGGNVRVQGARFRDTGGVNDHQEYGFFADVTTGKAIIGNVTFEDSTGPTQSMIVTGNEADGVFIDGAGSGTFTNGTYSNNGDDGIDLNNFTDVTISGITANGNNSDGVEIGFSGAVSISNSTFNNNGDAGFSVFNSTSLTLSDLTLSGNGVAGGTIINVGTVDYTTHSTGSVDDTVELTSTQFQRTTPAQQRITYAGVTSLTINAQGGADTIHVRSTLAATTYVVNTGDGNDTINVGNASNSLDDILGSLTINGGNNGATPTSTLSVSACDEPAISNTLAVGDIVNFNDQGDASNNTYTLAASNAAPAPGMATVTFNTVETINLNAGTGNDVINVTATAASVNVNVSGGAGNDVVTVTTTGASSNVVISGDGGTDTITINNTGTGSVLHAGGGAGTDTLILNGNGTDSGVQLNGDADADNFELQVTGTGSSVEVNGGGGNDAIRVFSTVLTSTTELNGDDGNDTFTIGSALPSLFFISGEICIDGGNHDATTIQACAGTGAETTVVVGDTIVILDQGAFFGHIYAVDGSTILRSGAATITYANAETLELNTSGNSDTITLSGPPAFNQVIVNSNAGNDTINVQATAIGSATEINAGSGNDTVNIGSAAGSLDSILGVICVDGQGHAVGDTINFNDDGDTNDNLYVLTPETFQRSGTALVAYFNFENLNLFAGLGHDTIRVLDTNPGTVNQLLGNEGSDRFLICHTSSETNLFGENGNDEFAFADGATLSGGAIDGGSGVDLLNYNAYTSPVKVNLSGAVYVSFPTILPNGAPNPTPANLPAFSATGTSSISGIENIVGGQSNDMLVGDDGPNLIDGNNGNDLIDGLGGDDILHGGNGDDSIFGGGGNDQIDGGAGNDFLFGQLGDDLIIGGPGKDFFLGGLGFDLFVIDNCCDVLQAQEVIDAGGVGPDGGQIILRNGLQLERPSFTGAAEICDPTPPPGPGQVVASLTSDQLFVQSLYQKFLNRSGSPLEIQSWVNGFALGWGRTQIAHAIANSAEARSVFIQQLYFQYLNRAADAGGLAAWMNAFKLGMTREQIEARILASDEYLQLQGGAAQFVNSLYLKYLGRNAEQAGMNHWLAVLGAGTSRLQVIEAIMNSAEGKSYFVSNLYLSILGRSPDLGGLSGWIQALNQGAKRHDVLIAFLASDEYYAKL